MKQKFPGWAESVGLRSGQGIRVQFRSGASLYLTFCQNEQLMVVSSSGKIDIHRCENDAITLCPTRQVAAEPKQEL